MKKKRASFLNQPVICGVGSRNHPGILGAQAGYQIANPLGIHKVALGGLGGCIVNRLYCPSPVNVEPNSKTVVVVGSEEFGTLHTLPPRG